MKKEEDKRLLIPKDSFEEEASEGLGRLNKEEASEDLRELKDRMERRMRKPRMIWLPAAAAVVILLVASTVYIALFRDRSGLETEIAMMEKPITDTALIAMAQPITTAETKSTARSATPSMEAIPTETADELMKADATYDKAAEEKGEIVAIMEAVEEEEVAEEVIVEAMPGLAKAAVADKKEKTIDAAMAEKKERTAAAKTMEETAVAMPSTGVGMPDRQAGPVEGMEEFNNWMQRNIKYPKEVMPRERQVVVVTFKISADSTLYNLKAERSAGEPFTKEAFRLLREGPKWVPAIRNNLVVEEEIRISIIFK